MADGTPDRPGAGGPRWGIAPALFSAAVAGLAGALAAVLFRRPEVLVLAVPLLGYVLYGLWTRPTEPPTMRAGVGAQTLYEGQQTSTEVTVEAAGAATAAVWQRTSRWLVPDPPSGGRVFVLDHGRGRAEIGAGIARWGIHDVPGVRLVLTSSLGAWRWSMITSAGSRIKALPLRADFSASNVVPRPAGMIGQHASRRPGDNGELSDVREFRIGDRLRRINWRVSSRTGRLHVNSTWSERDTEVQLVLDSVVDVGWSEGVGGLASSLDTGVRAASAIAEHYLHAGDRVSVIDLGARGRDVRAGSGRHHLRRINDTLVIASADRLTLFSANRHLPPGSLMIVLSPLLADRVIGHLVHGLQSGHAAVIIDTMPDGLTDPGWYTPVMRADDPAKLALAWRLRLVEREVTVAAIRDLGVPVVRWKGPGTLDEVLRDVSRPAPRLVGR